MIWLNEPSMIESSTSFFQAILPLTRVQWLIKSLLLFELNLNDSIVTFTKSKENVREIITQT